VAARAGLNPRPFG